MKTTLDVFNKVSEHLLTQNEKALDASGECAYRGETGLKCAIGCLIKDEFYAKHLEYQDLSRTGPLANALHESGVILTDEIVDLLRTLQRVHDHKKPELWKQELEKVKLRFFWGMGNIFL